MAFNATDIMGKLWFISRRANTLSVLVFPTSAGELRVITVWDDVIIALGSQGFLGDRNALILEILLSLQKCDSLRFIFIKLLKVHKGTSKNTQRRSCLPNWKIDLA